LVCACNSGNIFYGAAILLRFPVIDLHFWAATFPFIVGSLGVLVFDITTLVQASMYGGF
jgi:hypothetical protein